MPKTQEFFTDDDDDHPFVRVKSTPREVLKTPDALCIRMFAELLLEMV